MIKIKIFMKYPILKNHRTHREQVIKIFESKFQEKNVSYQISVAEN